MTVCSSSAASSCGQKSARTPRNDGSSRSMTAPLAVVWASITANLRYEMSLVTVAVPVMSAPGSDFRVTSQKKLVVVGMNALPAPALGLVYGNAVAITFCSCSLHRAMIVLTRSATAPKNKPQRRGRLHLLIIRPWSTDNPGGLRLIDMLCGERRVPFLQRVYGGRGRPPRAAVVPPTASSHVFPDGRSDSVPKRLSCAQTRRIR